MKVRYILFMAVAFLPLQSMGQEKPADKVKPEKPQKVTVTPYGFIRNYLNFDSRRTITSCGGEYLMIPYDEDWNITPEEEAALIGNGVTAPEGTDLRFDRNAVPQAHLLALSSRFGLNLNGPGIWVWQSSNGKLEADFAGFGTNNTVLRLRLAYLQLTRGGRYGQSLTIGQNWHPLSFIPDVLGMAAGAPFRPHSRTPQISYEIWTPAGLGFTVSALWQYQYTSPGPDGESAKYANDAILPELFFGMAYDSEHWRAQIGVDYNRLTVSQLYTVPYTMPGVSGPVSMSTDVRFRGDCHSFSPMAAIQFMQGKFDLKMYTVLAQNLGHLTIPGSGYAFVADGSSFQFQPLTASVSYLNMSYGRRWRANLFLGYHKNLGLADGQLMTDATTGKPVAGFVYTKKGVNNINSIYRIAPSISFNTKAFNIGLEYELTAVTYGDLQPDGTVANNANLRQVPNHRICALVKYNF
ncbi:MAG: hypothetical protein K5918_04740 [Bacteroidales bacterium]|nr:hypothetical protein [Bacteroidales bacterium]